MQRALDWYEAYDWPAERRAEVVLDLAERILDRGKRLDEVPALLDRALALAPVQSDDLESLFRSARAARLRARWLLATDKPAEAFSVLEAALQEPACPAIWLALDLDLAALPPEAAPWEARAAAAQRARGAASAAMLLIAEGVALARWAALLEEAGRTAEATAARADAEWIAARCPNPELQQALRRGEPRAALP